MQLFSKSCHNMASLVFEHIYLPFRTWWIAPLSLDNCVSAFSLFHWLHWLFCRFTYRTQKLLLLRPWSMVLTYSRTLSSYPASFRSPPPGLNFFLFLFLWLFLSLSLCLSLSFPVSFSTHAQPTEIRRDLNAALALSSFPPCSPPRKLIVLARCPVKNFVKVMPRLLHWWVLSSEMLWV